MTERENWLRAARFQGAERIPINFGFSAACLLHYPREALDDLKAEHPLLFPGFRTSGKTSPPALEEFPPSMRAGQPYTDSWGCVWETAETGIAGAVAKPAIPDWEAFEQYAPPSPEEHDGLGPIQWPAIRKNIAAAKAGGRLTKGKLRHGHTFLTLTYLRGYENLLFDMIDEHPLLPKLIDMVEAFNRGLVERYLEAGVDCMHYPEDLGMQQGPMLSPPMFRRYIKPSYERLIKPAKEAGCIISKHSDGDIRELMEDILDTGIEMINLQDLVNGIDWIKTHLKGRVCVELDIDRQRITRFGTPREIEAHVRQAVEQLGSPEGGLTLQYGLYPGVPLENVKALMDAMETYSSYYA